VLILPLQGLAAQTVLRELLEKSAFGRNENAMKAQALLYALRTNNWRSVQLMVNAGVMLQAMDFERDISKLYPRKYVQDESDEAAVPNGLYVFMQSDKVKLKKIEMLRNEYRKETLNFSALCSNVSHYSPSTILKSK
jgi:hypothetical protein